MHTGAMSAEQQKSFFDQVLVVAEVVAAIWEEPSMVTHIVGFAFLTFNSGMAVYQSNRAVGAVSFGAFSFLDLAMLFYCQRLYNRTPPGSPRREHLKMAVWLLTVMLTFAAFMLLEFWFSDKRERGAKIY